MSTTRSVPTARSARKKVSSAPRSEEHTSELQSHSDLVCRLLLEHAIPVIYTLSLHDAHPISMILHKPVNPWIFNVRAPYQREAEKAVMHLATIGLTHIALVHVDDTFGADCAIGAQKGFERAKIGRAHV